MVTATTTQTTSTTWTPRTSRVPSRSSRTMATCWASFWEGLWLRNSRRVFRIISRKLKRSFWSRSMTPQKTQKNKTDIKSRGLKSRYSSIARRSRPKDPLRILRLENPIVSNQREGAITRSAPTKVLKHRQAFKSKTRATRSLLKRARLLLLTHIRRPSSSRGRRKASWRSRASFNLMSWITRALGRAGGRSRWRRLRSHWVNWHRHPLRALRAPSRAWRGSRSSNRIWRSTELTTSQWGGRRDRLNRSH